MHNYKKHWLSVAAHHLMETEKKKLNTVLTNIRDRVLVMIIIVNH